MPKKPSQAHNPEDEPAVRAAHIAGSSVRKAALITASGAILAALLGGLWLWYRKRHPWLRRKNLWAGSAMGQQGRVNEVQKSFWKAKEFHPSSTLIQKASS